MALAPAATAKCTKALQPLWQLEWCYLAKQIKTSNKPQDSPLPGSQHPEPGLLLSHSKIRRRSKATSPSLLNTHLIVSRAEYGAEVRDDGHMLPGVSLLFFDRFSRLCDEQPVFTRLLTVLFVKRFMWQQIALVVSNLSKWQTALRFFYKNKKVFASHDFWVTR